MKLSARARYALRMMLEISRHAPQEAVSLGQVAERTGISRRFLDQLASSLKNANLIHSQGGRAGGYRLSRPPAEIPVGCIVEAAIGPISIIDCLAHPGTCLKADVCDCRPLYSLINNRINQVLYEISLADLGDRRFMKELCLGEAMGSGQPGDDAKQICPEHLSSKP